MDTNTDLLSISEMARLRRVTTETLRHYDRIDLFKPCYINPETGYRYYSFMQYEVLGTIKELAQMGMSLEDIKAFLNHRNLDESIIILEKQHEILLKEIQEKKALEKIMHEKIEFLHGIKQNNRLNELFICHFPERYILSEGKPGMTTKQMCKEITCLEGRLKEIAPVFASNRIGAFCYDSINTFDSNMETFDYSPFIECDSKYKKDPLFRVIPESDYVCIRYHGRFGTYSDSFKLVAKYMKDNNLKQNGCFYTNYELDITLTKDFDDTILLLQVPVKKV
ncbi:MAG: MerR family transcriptional regulator [Butyrivibrio sp.]|nr:MerR family transcriptional regulator [Butyrivibrio sp.]